MRLVILAIKKEIIIFSTLITHVYVGGETISRPFAVRLQFYLNKHLPEKNELLIMVKNSLHHCRVQWLSRRFQ